MLLPSLTPKYLGLPSITYKTIVIHNNFRHCRVHFYAFVRQPFSKQLYTEIKEWGPNQTRMFLGFTFTTVLSCAHKCDDQSYLHYSPQFKYMKLLVFFTFYGYITNSQSGHFPVGLIAQLVEHCTGVAEVMGSNPVEAWFFFRLKFHNCLSYVDNCDDQSSQKTVVQRVENRRAKQHNKLITDYVTLSRPLWDD